MKITSLRWLAPCLAISFASTLHGQLPTPIPAVPLAPPAVPENPVYKDPHAPVEKRVEDLLSYMTQDEKLTIIAGTPRGWMGMLGIPRLGIPVFVMSDAGMGDRTGNSTAYPAGMGLASTWDVEQAKRDGTAQARDSRARGIVIMLAPAMDLYRAPMNGRNFEYFGEDPVLAGDIASAYITGAQSQGVGVAAKHFAANDQEPGRDKLSSNVDERTLRELDLKQFEICVRNGATGIMCSYNPLNGIYTSANKWLLTDILRNEWGFKGLVMSDWGACHNTLADANAGLDLEMPHADVYKAAKLKPLIASGAISQATIDEKVRRILRVAFTLGWFDRQLKDTSIPLDDPTSDAVALKGAEEGVTLLKNTGNLLPLNPMTVKKVVVLGPNAEPAMTGGGGSSKVNPIPARAISVLAGIKNLLGNGPDVVVTRVSSKPGAVPPEYADQIKAADVAVVCVGFAWKDNYADQPHSYEGEGKDRSYTLPQGQEDLIKSVVALNPKTIVIVNAGGSVATVGWIDQVPVLIDAFYPGQEGGNAIAEILFGKVNPSGHLCFSWDKKWEDCASYGNYPLPENHMSSNTYKEGVFAGYRWFDSKPDIQPLFEFGFGMSYTTFQFSDLKVSAPDAQGNITATATITNTGRMAGAEVAQLYVQPPAVQQQPFVPAPPRTPGDGAPPDPTGPVAVLRPVRELKGFTRVELQPGESKTATITVARNDLAYWDPNARRWIVTPGAYVFNLGASSRQLPLHVGLNL